MVLSCFWSVPRLVPIVIPDMSYIGNEIVLYSIVTEGGPSVVLGWFQGGQEVIQRWS